MRDIEDSNRALKRATCPYRSPAPIGQHGPMTVLKNLRHCGHLLRVVLDLVCIRADSVERRAFVHQPGHRVDRGHLLKKGAYGQVLVTTDIETGATTLYYDRPRAPWFSPTKVKLIASDTHALAPVDLFAAFELLPNARLSRIELAFDFPIESGLTAGFVVRNVLFGKSQWFDRRPGLVRFGTRRSAKFVRAYIKPKLHVFRIELQLNAAWFRRAGIRDCFDFWRIPELVLRRQILFCKLDWDALRRCIKKTVPNADRALELLEWQPDDLHATLRFLRGELRLTNTHRFLIPLALNHEVARALKDWADQWPRHVFGLDKAKAEISRVESEWYSPSKSKQE
jgi:hypothetical protein